MKKCVLIPHRCLFVFHDKEKFTKLFEKRLFLIKILRENIDTSKSPEKWYKGVIRHAGHESGLTFLITSQELH